MKRLLPRLTLVLLLVPLSPHADASGRLPGLVLVRDAAAQQGVATITITYANGQITVSPENATVRKGAQVQWTSPDGGAVWVVAFPGSTPFANGQHVFSGGGNPAAAGGAIPPQSASGEHKYWVFYPDAGGNYRMLDPKLIVVD